MGPTWQRVNDEAIRPYMDGQIEQKDALGRARMRFEPLAASERRRDFGRVMRIVVEHDSSGGFSLDLESTADSAELCQRRRRQQLQAAADQLPLRDDLRGKTPYGAPQLDVEVRAARRHHLDELAA